MADVAATPLASAKPDLAAAFASESEAETRALGGALGERLEAGDVVALRGELGAGKTVFVKGVAAGLGIDPETVTSPTFTFVHFHQGRRPLFHVDLYRIERPEAVEGIGWDEAARQRNLQRVVNNSRFLLLPWVRVRNLASTVLSMVVRRLRADWQGRYGVEPLLVETLVDARRYRGSCYRAANWQVLGRTTGRGRMDRGHRRHGAAPKTVLIYPLVRDAARRLREA